MRRHATFFAILLCGALLAATRGAELADLKLLDFQFRALRALFPRSVSRDVAIVGIDEETLKQFPEPLALWHRHLARFFGAMAQARPAIVGVDVVLPDRSFESVLP